jgi:hypothetical protein
VTAELSLSALIMADTSSQRDGQGAISRPTERSPLLARRSSIGSESSSSLRASSPDISTSNGDPSDGRTPAEQEAAAAPAGNKPDRPPAEIMRIVAVLLIGVFVANADGSLLLATHPVIASTFDQMGSSSWLIISYALAGAATQTIVRVTRSLENPLYRY